MCADRLFVSRLKETVIGAERDSVWLLDEESVRPLEAAPPAVPLELTPPQVNMPTPPSGEEQMADEEVNYG